MKLTKLFLILIIIYNLKVECQKQHIQRILSRKNIEPPSKLFNMYNADNRYILQNMEFNNHDMIFEEALQDFLEKIRVLAQRTNELNLTHTEYNLMVNITIDERNREAMWRVRDYYEALFRTHVVVNNNTMFSLHPLIRFPSVSHMLRKWMYNFMKDMHKTKNRNEFYAKMQLNVIKDSVGYIKLFYYYFDAVKFYSNMTFNMPRYRAALYKRVEQEMPYLNFSHYY